MSVQVVCYEGFMLLELMRRSGAYIARSPIDPESLAIAGAVLFASSFIFVALKAFQQLNVQHDQKLYIVPTSLVMAVAEVSLITGIVKAGSLWSAIPIGLGAGIGCLVAMEVHRRLRK